MKPAEIDHANIFKDGNGTVDYKDVLVWAVLSEAEIVAIYHYNLYHHKVDYDVHDVKMLVWVRVKDGEATDVSYIATYPAELGEMDFPVQLVDGVTQEAFINFVTDNYFGNEERYDER